MIMKTRLFEMEVFERNNQVKLPILLGGAIVTIHQSDAQRLPTIVARVGMYASASVGNDRGDDAVSLVFGCIQKLRRTDFKSVDL